MGVTIILMSPSAHRGVVEYTPKIKSSETRLFNLDPAPGPVVRPLKAPTTAAFLSSRPYGA